MSIETFSIVLGLTAGIMQLTGYIAYNWKANGKINTGSWTMWALAGVLDFLSYLYLTKGDWVVNVLPAVCALAAVGTFISACIKKRFAWPDRMDCLFIGMDVAITGVWYLTNAVIANLLYQATTVLSFLPMYRGVWTDREAERLLPWLIWTFAYSLLTASVWLRFDRWEELVYPMSHLMTHLVMVVIVLQVKQRPPPDNGGLFFLTGPLLTASCSPVYCINKHLMKHIYIATSPIHGHGVRIGEDVKKGEVIAHIKGKMKFKINKTEKDALDNPDWVGIAKNRWIDPDKPYKFLNHSCNPSVGVKGRTTLVALRDMKEGEEVTIDYSTIEGDPRWKMNCSCGEKNCRGIIKSIQFMPKNQFEKYLPYVPTYFRNLYLDMKYD